LGGTARSNTTQANAAQANAAQTPAGAGTAPSAGENAALKPATAAMAGAVNDSPGARAADGGPSPVVGASDPAPNGASLFATRHTSAPGMAARPALAQPVPVDQVAVHIQRAAAAGEDRIRIRLHPAELGQIDVRLKVGHDGVVRAVVAVDRAETFNLMQRDAHGLERALQDAGLKTDSGSLSFNLRGEGQGGQGGEPEARYSPTAGPANQHIDQAARAAAHTAPGPAPIDPTRALDMHV